MGRSDRAVEITTEFARSKVDVLVTTGSPTTLAAKRATAVIPIIFVSAADPIGGGLVASLAHPGGNVSGLSNQQSDLATKRLELLRDLIPGFRRLASLVNVANPTAIPDMQQIKTAAWTLSIEVIALEVRSAEASFRPTPALRDVA